MTQVEFNHAVQNHYTPLKGYAMKLARDVENANDLLQETMLRAIRNRDKFAEGTNMRGWLVTIMKNIFINHYRRMVKGAVVSDDTENQFFINSLHHTSGNHAQSKIALKELYDQVNALSEKLRTPFLMSFEGYKYDEIAEKLNIPLGTVKIRIHNARQKLQENLIQYGREFGLTPKKSRLEHVKEAA